MRRHALLLLVFGFGTLLGCDTATVDPSEPVSAEPDVQGTSQTIDELMARVEREADGAGKHVTVDLARAQIFGPAGDYGGGVLTPGTTFPPDRSLSVLLRWDDGVGIFTVTTGLPPGAYTTWWVFFNNPEACLLPDADSGSRCSIPDLFTPETVPSAFWSTGGVVGPSGIGFFHDRTGVGEVPEREDQIAFPGPGLLKPRTAELHYIIKYHGPASSDPDVLYEQTHTLLGSCFEGANAHDTGPAFGVQCFDPQVVIH